MADGNWAQKGILRFLLKILWTVGGHRDEIDGLPRARGADLAPVLPTLVDGDIVLMGNNGLLSHVGVHVGDGVLVHSMATEKTMRGWWGSWGDALRRLLGMSERFTGVMEERWADFFDRYERDTWVVLRHPDLDGPARQRGVERVQSLVGRDYDYDFTEGDDEYYCTEIVVEYLQAALEGPAPKFVSRRVRIPLLVDSQVIEPASLLDEPSLVPVAHNAAAELNYPTLASQA